MRVSLKQELYEGRIRSLEGQLRLYQGALDIFSDKYNTLYSAAEKERDELRAEIDRMKKQEPVYLFRRKGLDYFCTCSKERYEAFSAKPRLFEVKTLYALPGAKGEEK
jgi:hypothetical protein